MLMRVCSVADCTARLIQQNDGYGSMNRSWAEFKVGFGDASGNYWLGNDLLSQLTANYRYKLRFDLQQNGTGNWYYAEYSRFRVLPEADKYQLKVGGFSGNSGDGDSLPFYHYGRAFSTFDRDNDVSFYGNCAASLGGGYWYRDCGAFLANGARSTRYFYWGNLPGGVHLQSTRMWLQCK